MDRARVPLTALRAPAAPPRPARRRAAVVVLVALVAACAAAAPARASRPDTLGLRVELGASSDLTNELFYQDEFVDTLFLGRRLVGDPEHRVAGVLFVALEGTRGSRATRFALQNELSLGDRLSRNATSLAWRSAAGADWQLAATPRVEFRDDRTFGRDLEEWRADVPLRVRRRLGDGLHTLELGARGELVRSRGEGSAFLLDRQGVRLSVAAERFELLGQDLRVGYGLWMRAFPDSASRDQFEHLLEARFRRDFPSGASLVFDVDVARRLTMDVVTTSRDNFWEQRASLEGVAALAPGWTVRARLDGEAQQYEVPDSTLYFDYRMIRGRLAPRWEPLPGLQLAAGPRAEALWSPWNRAEEYVELAGAFDLEWLGGRAWWSVSPALGWREYAESDRGAVALHSSYAFYEVSAFGDQPIPGGLRVRTFVTARLESHDDPSQDARSLYFSLDVRKLF